MHLIYTNTMHFVTQSISFIRKAKQKKSTNWYGFYWCCKLGKYRERQKEWNKVLTTQGNGQHDKKRATEAPEQSRPSD